jgi:hypothetical protein
LLLRRSYAADMPTGRSAGHELLILPKAEEARRGARTCARRGLAGWISNARSTASRFARWLATSRQAGAEGAQRSSCCATGPASPALDGARLGSNGGEPAESCPTRAGADEIAEIAATRPPRLPQPRPGQARAHRGESPPDEDGGRLHRDRDGSRSVWVSRVVSVGEWPRGVPAHHKWRQRRRRQATRS